jgi:hypothetical protein
MRFARTIVGVIVSAAAAVAAVPAGADDGAIGVRLIASSSQAPSGLSRSYIIERVAPGATVRRRIEVTNSTAATVDVSVYAAAARTRGGAFRFGAGHAGNELTSWTSVDRPTVRLASREKAVETITFAIPRFASNGERYAVVWAEASSDSTRVGVRLVNRVGIRSYVSVGHGSFPPTRFSVGNVRATRSSTGAPVVRATIANDGTRALAFTATLSLTQGPGGLRAGPFLLASTTAIAPRAEIEPRIVLDHRLPSGPWRARLRVSSGNVIRTTSATIRFPDLPPLASKPEARPERLTALAIGLAALLTLAVAATLLRRRPRVQA